MTDLSNDGSDGDDGAWERVDQLLTIHVAGLASALQDIGRGGSPHLEDKVRSAWNRAVDLRRHLDGMRPSESDALHPRRAERPSRCRVLLVDDEPAVLRVNERLLSKRYDVVSAVDGIEAIEVLSRDSNFDVIVSDVIMPRCNGFDLYATVCERWPRLLPRVVFITAALYSPDAAEFFAIVRNPRVFKWDGSASLVSAIEALLAIIYSVPELSG